MRQCVLLTDNRPEEDGYAYCVHCQLSVARYHWCMLDQLYLKLDGRCCSYHDALEYLWEDRINLISIAHKRRILHEQTNQD